MAFAALGLDKAKATRGQYRIAESTLLLFAFLGGTLGGPSTGSGLGAACSATRPVGQPFNSHLFAIAAGQMLALGGLVGWWVSW